MPFNLNNIMLYDRHLSSQRLEEQPNLEHYLSLSLYAANGLKLDKVAEGAALLAYQKLKKTDNDRDKER
jgi:hypothetical protein